MTKIITCLALLSIISACTITEKPNSTRPQWDFDHNVQYRQTQLTDNSYQLIVVAQKGTQFSQLATFLIRQSKILCWEYGYKIEILSGVQAIDEIVGAPNAIMESLAATVECKAESIVKS